MSRPTVAIIGRPNVGKSTLFNRLVGKMDAIVDDISGVTRDRNYSDCEWTNRVFRIIDTGGYVPDSPDVFESVIRDQVELAILEADKIIFVVDVKDGVTPVDRIIADMVRSSGKQIILTVNKIDSEKQETAAPEFYELGIGDPHMVSAANGRRIGDYLDFLTEGFPEGNLDDDDPRLKIALVGRPNAGKSSLTNALLGFDRSIVTDIPGTTRDSIDSLMKYYGQEVVLIDTAGLRKKARVKEQLEYFSTVRTYKAISDSTVTVVMIDAENGLEHQDQHIIDEAVRRRKGIIIAVNKWDLIEKDTNTAYQFEKEMKKKLGALEYIPIIFVSALTKQRIYKLVDLALEIHAERKKKIPTKELNDFMLEKIQITPPPASPTGKEVKIKFITQVGSDYPIFLFFANYPKSIPDSYRRFIEKTIRNQYGFKGVPFTVSFKEK